MMAHDTGPNPPNAVSEETVEAVRAAIARYLAKPRDPPTDLRVALQAVAREARAKSVPPEHVLVILKSIWYEMPEVRSVETEPERTRVLQRIVTMCIKEYFAAE